MIKFIITAFVLFLTIIGHNHALDIDNYTAYLEELLHDEKFLDEYARWSFKLFSQPDYLYGDLNKTFPCPIVKDSIVPTSVHTLRPTDVKCVGAIGDSLTAGLGAHAITPIGLFFENRGLSWSVGGDQTFNQVFSLPNSLRQYNAQLEGYSTKVSAIFMNGQDAKNNHLNVAKSGDRSNNMPYQAQLLMDRLKQEALCNWDNDWKVITLFVGGNDLCSFCEDPNVTKHTPEQYLSYVRDTLNLLYDAPIPRTLVNLVLVLDVRGVKQLNSGGFVCQTLHKRTCPCAAFPTEEQAKILDDYVERYQQILIDLIDTDHYDGRDDFTVVIQPFMAKTRLPYKPDHTIDFSYFAPDCFHFSGKGHAQAALSLWNNMLEPVNAKQWFWHMDEPMKCPTAEYPYIFTKKNSPQPLEESKQSSAVSSTQDTSTTTAQIFTSTEKHRHHKHHKSDSDKYDRKQIAVFAAFFLLMLILIIVSVSKREQIRIFVHGAGRHRLNGFTNPQYVDENDDIDIWKRSNSNKSGYSINNDMPKTHGTRITFE